MWFPSNADRRQRLENLVTDIKTRQTGIVNGANDTDVEKQKIKDLLDELVAAHKLPTFQELNEQAMAVMSPAKREEWMSFITKGRKFSAFTDLMIQLGLNAMLPNMGVNAIKDVMAFGKWVYGRAIILRVSQVIRAFRLNGVAAGLREVAELQGLLEEQGVSAEGGEGLTEGLDESVEALEEVAQASRLAKIAGGAGRLVKFLNALGFAAAVIFSGIEIAGESEQKDKLIDKIHQAQVMRLVTYYIQREVEFMIQQLMAMGLYAKSLKDATKEVSRYLGDNIVGEIRARRDELKWEVLENDLETQDGEHWDEDDLKSPEVIKRAIVKEKQTKRAPEASQ